MEEIEGGYFDNLRAAPLSQQRMVRQGKSLLRVTVERWGPVVTGGFPPDAAPAG